MVIEKGRREATEDRQERKSSWPLHVEAERSRRVLGDDGHHRSMSENPV
jgi:hypothetical protein